MKPAMVQLLVRTRQSQAVALRKLSRELNIPVASLVRTAIDFALEDFRLNKFPFRTPADARKKHVH